jgi:hypothetical protein
LCREPGRESDRLDAGVAQLSVDRVVEECREVADLGIRR